MNPHIKDALWGFGKMFAMIFLVKILLRWALGIWKTIQNTER